MEFSYAVSGVLRRDYPVAYRGDYLTDGGVCHVKSYVAIAWHDKSWFDLITEHQTQRYQLAQKLAANLS